VPSGPIQPRLPGFLDLLQLKNNGQPPSLLSDLVAGVIDVGAWYGFDRMEAATYVYNTLNNTFATAQPIGGPAVPQDEVWLLWQAAIRFNFNPATTTALILSTLQPVALLPLNTDQFVSLADNVTFDSTPFTVWPGVASQVAGTPKMWRRPLLLPGGTRLGLSIGYEHTDAVGAGFATASYTYSPLKS